MKRRIQAFIGGLSVARKIAISSTLVIILTTVSGVFSLATFQSSRNIDEQITNQYYPLISKLKAFRVFVQNTNELSSKWMYSPNDEDKASLRNALENTYPVFETDINGLISNWPDSTGELVGERLAAFIKVTPSIQELMDKLNSRESYADDFLLFELVALLDDEITAPLETLVTQLDLSISNLEDTSSQLIATKYSSFDRLEIIIIVMTLLAIIIGVTTTIFATRSIVKPIHHLNDTIQQLSRGSIPLFELKASKDEIGQIVESVKKLRKSLISTATFAQEIGKGNLEADHELLSKEDVLGQALLNMKQNLSAVISETNQVVSKVAIDGEFYSRLDLEGKQGAWLDLSNSINELFESITVPFQEVGKILTAMANGDLTDQYQNEARGEVEKLTNSLNFALRSLKELLTDIGNTADIIDLTSQEMLSSGEEMITNVVEISTAIGEMSTGAQSQVNKVDESSQLVENILSSTDEMISDSELIYKAARKGVTDSERGAEMIGNVAGSISEIRNASNETNTAMKTLATNSKEIERVLGVITEIASQTNLLALNAAIEAAQAGDAGRGFAVVAEEIRKLAEDSRNSAKEIQKLISNVSQDTSQTVDLMNVMTTEIEKSVEAANEASDVFKDIADSSTSTLGFSERILKSSKDQSTLIKKVVTNTESVVVIAEETAAGTEEVAASANQMEAGMNNYIKKSRDLNEVSDTLKVNLERFTLNKQENTDKTTNND
ncbi:MAG: methyl-accepting chemotaxis protein [Cytophagales bacterium]|nr:methyl-accepting chemotaxis protein [Cytophagales bacterium]